MRAQVTVEAIACLTFEQAHLHTQCRKRVPDRAKAGEGGSSHSGLTLYNNWHPLVGAYFRVPIRFFNSSSVT